MAIQEQSPITGILAEDEVVIDFGEHEGKSVMEVSDTDPEFYDYLKDLRAKGNFAIRRSKDKIFRLYVASSFR
jgi:hypothetical protein